ncbi:HNH endonuclease [Rhodoferax sp. BLA1]|uniref:HNH endonuclease n=1 Tax=Rhodoferax sp. BLA1 TaxID=2576062 RepID=UPI0015D3CA17|nr:HNH endonuclease [Rhodoferax sp. BLA1]
MNKWNIPAWLENEVLERDRNCVYCGVSFAQVSKVRREQRSWEHIVNDAKIVTRDNIALCCIGCNASKGAKTLEQWLASRYCRDRQISAQSVSPVVQAALAMRVSPFTGADPSSS